MVCDGDLEQLGRTGVFLGQHVYTSRPGVAVQINAFNFPVWGMLEKLAPAFIAGLPTIVKPASQSASTWSCTPPWSTDGCWRRIPAVCAEPVKATESWTPRWSSRSPADQASSWSEPSGRIPDSMMRRTTSSVR